MEFFKMTAFSLLIALAVGFAAHPNYEFTPDNDTQINNAADLTNMEPIDEKFEGGVKAYVIERRDKIEVHSPDGPGDN